MIFSSLGRSLRFASLVRRYPEHADFISMGMGIEARYQRCKKYWNKHLELSRQFQIDALARVGPGVRVAVLGAGRLLDVPHEFLHAGEYKVELFDADPGCARVWQRYGLSGLSEFDLSANFLNFSKCVQNALEARESSIEKLAIALSSLELSAPILPGAPFDVVISLNLLSQIPLYFHDYLDRSLENTIGVGSDQDGNFPKPLSEIWCVLAERLQRQHQELIAQSTKRLQVIITDRSFLYYRQDQANWRDCAALYLPLDQLRAAESDLRDGWFWHIAPQGLEQQDFGVIHDVQARAHFY